MSAVLVIAGTDSSGGAGLTRDVATLSQLGTDTLCAVTAVTAQSDRAVAAVHAVPADMVRAQIAAALASGRVAALKIGMLATAANARAVAEMLARTIELPVVLDPVLVASSGGALLDAEGVKVLRAELLSRVMLLTPNVPEAAALLNSDVARSEAQLLRQGEALLALGARAVLIKGGHFGGEQCTDLLFTNTTGVRHLRAPRIARTRRGSGCALASAIAAGLAAQLDLYDACVRAKRYIGEFFQTGK